MKLSASNGFVNKIDCFEGKMQKRKLLMRYVYPFTLVVCVFIVLLFVEYNHPYFFLNDDNRDYFLPNYIHNYRSLLNGELALYNFHQFLGIPHLALGQSGTLYPIVYLSIFLSKLIFNHYFAAIDIMVIIHLMIGSVGFYKFVSFFDIEHKICLFGGLTWALGSFVVYVSDSWVIVSAAAAYFPWMIFFSFVLLKNPSLKAVFGAVAVRLLLFYAGHIQYFIYSVIFEFLTVVLFLIYRYQNGNKIKCVVILLGKYIRSYLYVLIFSLPLLLPMWHQTTISADRSGRLVFEEFVGRKFPLSELISGLTYVGYGKLGYLSHIGIIVIYFLVIGLIIGLINRIKSKSKIQTNENVSLFVFLIPALIALLWATSTHFNQLIYIIPILNRFRYPFKLVFFLDFYLIVITTIILSNLMKRYSSDIYKKVLCILIIAVQMFNFIFIYANFPYNFGTHLDKIPLEEKLQTQLSEGRIVSAGFEFWSSNLKDDSNFITAPTLGFNYATLFGLNYFAGTEPLRSTATSKACLGLNFKAVIDSNNIIPVDYLRKAGVRWYIVPVSKYKEYAVKFSSYGIIKKYQDKNRVIFIDEKAYPMVADSFGKIISYSDYMVSANTISLSVDFNKNDTIIFNNLFNPFFEGYIDGEKVEIKPVNKIHFSIEVPKGKHRIKIKYRDPYFIAGLYVSFVFLLLLLIFLACKRFLINNFQIRNAKKLNNRATRSNPLCN